LGASTLGNRATECEDERGCAAHRADPPSAPAEPRLRWQPAVSAPAQWRRRGSRPAPSSPAYAKCATESPPRSAPPSLNDPAASALCQRAKSTHALSAIAIRSVCECAESTHCVIMAASAAIIRSIFMSCSVRTQESLARGHKDDQPRSTSWPTKM